MIKIELNEKMKHRIIGLAVLLSIAAIFMPAIVKKSTQRNEREISLNLKLPQRPIYPQLSESQQADSLKEDIAQLEDEIEISLENDITNTTVVNVAKAEPIDLDALSGEEQIIISEKKAESSMEKKDSSQSQNIAANNVATVEQHKDVAPRQMTELKRDTVAAPALKAQQPAVAKIEKPGSRLAGNFSVQLGSFSMQSNADALVKQLKSQGFSAKIKKVKTQKGYVYKVYVGHAVSRLHAEKLKERLAENTKLKGLVVSGVS